MPKHVILPPQPPQGVIRPIPQRKDAFDVICTALLDKLFPHRA